MTSSIRSWRSTGFRLFGAAVGVLVLALVAVVALTWDTNEPAATPHRTPPAATSSSSPASSEPIVLAISVDGLNPEAIEILGDDRAPAVHRLMREGVSTLDARTAVEATTTLPNHTGMLTGRSVSGDGGHDVTSNDDHDGTVHQVNGSYVPSILDIAHDNGLRTALLAEKEKFDFLVRSWDDTNGAEDHIGRDDGRDKIDIASVTESDAAQRARDLVADDEVDLAFVHLTGPDDAGHDHGWLSPQYLDAVEAVDASLGSIIEVVDGDPGLAQRVSIVLTADHGGARDATSHEDEMLEANRRVPFIVWGHAVSVGRDAYDLNARRRPPGAGQPDYAGPQPIRNIDLANTTLRLLGLEPLPGAMSTRWPELRLR